MRLFDITTDKYRAKAVLPGCDLTAPDFQVAKLYSERYRTYGTNNRDGSGTFATCKYLLSPNRAGDLMVVGFPRHVHLPILVETVAVREPPYASSGTVSTGRGIIVTLAGLFVGRQTRPTAQRQGVEAGVAPLAGQNTRFAA
jgi:hypothetical protein